VNTSSRPKREEFFIRIMRVVTLYWLLGTSVRKIANFAFSSSLFALHEKLERGKSKDFLLALSEKSLKPTRKTGAWRMRLGKTCPRWARELPQASSRIAVSVIIVL